MNSELLSRETDLQIAGHISDDINENNENYFILTGSYAVDLLTKTNIEHNDIDANVFTDNIQISIGKVGLILESYNNLSNTLKTDTRLEYINQDNARQLEIQFIEYEDSIKRKDGIDFVLSSQYVGHDVVVPSVLCETKINQSEYHKFAVKSLPFVIATWALRISGIALNQKREVRQSDVDHFKCLIDMPHNNEAVKVAIKNHPQAPAYLDPTDVLDCALAYKGTSSNV